MATSYGDERSTGHSAGDGLQAQVDAVQAQIAALKARWPRHSVPAALWQEMEELEDRLRELTR
jgi:hypothetical protein